MVVQVEVVRSVLMLSDVFTERSQYEWMLHKFLELSRSHPSEDELMQQLLTLGVCKAVALLAPVSHTIVLSKLNTFDMVRLSSISVIYDFSLSFA